MSEPAGFAWTERKNGEVVITHEGRVAAVLRGAKAARFVSEMIGIVPDEAQARMARLTGNYKRGNEQRARRHPRNR